MLLSLMKAMFLCCIYSILKIASKLAAILNPAVEIVFLLKLLLGA
jgi:hypothetical protein